MSKLLRTSAASAILVVAPAMSSFARSTHPASSTNDFNKILALGVALVVGLVLAAINTAKKPKPLSKEKVAQLGSQAVEFLKQIESGRFTPPDTPLLLGADETALLHESSKLIEARATRVYAGGGTRVQGIYVGGGQSTSVQSLKELDSGTLTLTTKRLVFTGTMESRVVNGKDIVSVEPLADAIEISTARKAKRQVYLVRNPILWATLLTTVSKGGISVSRKTQNEEEMRESAQLPQPESEPSTDIRFNCPHCGQHLVVEERGAEMLVNCPSCNEQIEIPGAPAPPLPPSVTAL